MTLFSRKQKNIENARRTKKAEKNKVRLNTNWFKPFLKGVAVSMVVAGLSFGLMLFNQKLSVAYWDIEADAHIKTKIENYFTAQTTLDFWHTRASVIQDDLIQRIPDIQYLEVSRILPDGLLIKAQARIPVALWEDPSVSTQVMLVDEKGKAYRLLARGENLDLPLFRLRQEELGKATHLVLQLKAKNPTQALLLSEVITMDEAWRLNFAHGEQWQLNTVRLEQDTEKVINVLMQPRWANGHWRMDARIPQRWFIRPAKQEVI